MRKKLFTFLLALVASVGLMNAAPNDSGSCGANVTYSFDGATGAMTITGTGPMTEYSSKSNCPWDGYRTSITSVTVTDGVTTVSSNSFGQCTSLQSVTIGNDVETIGEFSFNDCGTNFTSLTLGNSVKSVGFAAFLFGTNIAELVLPESLETINDYAFCQLRAITTVTIPSKVTSIGVSAFYNCNALTSIYTEATTPPTLGDGVFSNVNADLSTIPLYVPNGSVAAYTAAAQWNAFNIQGYDPAPVGPTNVCGDGLTWELNGGVLTISYDGVGTGEMYDFGYEYDETPVNVAPWKENKSAITTVIVGDGVKSIGNYAFNDLYENFTAVTIANSVERIGVSAFMNAKWVTEMTLPSSLKTIDRECFAANFGITSITIPSGVTSIGYHAFGYCTGLTSLTCEATTPPTLASGVFYKITSKTSDMSNIPLYVPSGSVAAYEAAAQWNAFDIHGYDPAPGGGSEPATVVAIYKSEFTSSGVTKEGVTLALSNGSMTSSDVVAMDGSFEFSTSLGKFTRITIETDANIMQIYENGYTSAGWPTGQNLGTSAVWTGESETVLISCMVAGMDNITITCTIEPTPASTDEQVPTNADPENPSYHYSTFFHSTQNYKLTNDGTTAFIADLSGNDLVLTEIAKGTQVIPANTAVILRKSGSADPVVLTPTEENGVSVNPEDNSLKGVDAITAVTSIDGLTTTNCYVLSGTNEYGVGFYRINSENLKAHKAYVKYAGLQNNAPKRMRFVFNQEQVATGIDNANADIKAEKRIENGQLIIIKNGVRYNVQGQLIK